ncbi:MAG: YbbR-like domain-containing protein [Acidobacteria bacterium]|nr:YbbR-like domain-containing protein [Acidobacteriota bacterium]MBI3470899.1 YbbR-like domain-containing protein [Candidatus Solibacter usitatus]
MMRFLTKNPGTKLFSLVVAVFLWITFTREPETGAFVSAPVEYKGMPDDLEIGSDLVSSVSIDLRGSASNVRKFAAAPSAVVLDFSGIHKPGEMTFHIDEQNVKLPAGMRLVRAVPAQLRLQFERRTSREVPVQARFAGSPPAGYVRVREEVKPRTLTVVGPESRVQRIEFAVTDPIDLTPVVGESEFRVEAYVGDPHVRFHKPQKVSVTVVVEKQ